MKPKITKYFQKKSNNRSKRNLGIVDLNVVNIKKKINKYHINKINLLKYKRYGDSSTINILCKHIRSELSKSTLIGNLKKIAIWCVIT